MILKAIKESINETIIQFSEGKLSEEEVLKLVNAAVHYNYSYRPYIWEMFFIQALELDKVPRNLSFLLALFSTFDNELHLLTDKEDTRSRVLQELNMPDIDKMYQDWLDLQNDSINIRRIEMLDIREKIQKRMRKP